MYQYFQNDPDFSRWLPIFQMISKLSGVFQMTANFPDDFKTVRIFQMIANFPDYLKTVRIFPDDCQFSGWFQNHPDFQDDCQFSVLTKKPFKLSQYFQIQNDPDFSRWFPIFWMVSKLSGFFPDDCQFSGLFQNCPDFSRWLPIFGMISKLSGFSRCSRCSKNCVKTGFLVPKPLFHIFQPLLVHFMALLVNF